MLLIILFLLAQITVPGVLSGPDPAQMETAPALGYHAVETGLKLPDGIKMGAPSSVAFDAQRSHARLQPRRASADGVRRQGRVRALASAKGVTCGRTACGSIPTATSGRRTSTATPSRR